MGAKELKAAILQEAVSGKLVPQIASEGNARNLLEQIRKEKLSHGFANSYGICGEKDKKSKSCDLRSKSQIRVTKKELLEITEEEIPFEIPENWCWCRLGELAEIITKGSSPSWQGINYVDEGILFVTSENVGDEELLLSKRKFLEQKFNEIQPRSILQKGDILTNIVGASIGRTAIFDLDIKNANINQAVALIRLKNKQLNSYIVKVLNSKTIIDQMTDNTVNTARANISLTTVENFKIPLPPLAEQKRIVAAIEKFMPLIEEYGKKETQLKAINEKIGTLTKKAILQEAVQGKLVPQIAAEGNARDLLGKIRKERLSHGFANSYGICGEKCKKSKSSDLRSKSQIRVTKKELPEITEDEIPFDIPESWCWCRLGEIVPFGVCQNAEPQEINDEDWILDLEDIEKDSGKILSFKTKKEVDSKSTKHIFKKGFVLYSKLRPYLNKCVIAPKDGFCTSEILPLDFGDMIYNKYAQLYLMSPFFVDYTNSLSFGVKMPRLGTEDGRKALFPLPPLAEQKRIVAAIEKMLPLCEKLGE